MNPAFQQAYNDHLAADQHWMAEIKRAFPHQWAGDIRYTDCADGEPGTSLRAAYDEYRRTRGIWESFLHPRERSAA